MIQVTLQSKKYNAEYVVNQLQFSPVKVEEDGSGTINTEYDYEVYTADEVELSEEDAAKDVQELINEWVLESLKKSFAENETEAS